MGDLTNAQNGSLIHHAKELRVGRIAVLGGVTADLDILLGREGNFTTRDDRRAYEILLL